MKLPEKSLLGEMPSRVDDSRNTAGVDSQSTSLPSQLQMRYKGMYYDISGHEGYVELELSAGASTREYLCKGRITEISRHGHPRRPNEFTCKLFVDSDSTGTLQFQTLAMKGVASIARIPFQYCGPNNYALSSIWGSIRMQNEGSVVAGTFLLSSFLE